MVYDTPLVIFRWGYKPINLELGGTGVPVANECIRSIELPLTNESPHSLVQSTPDFGEIRATPHSLMAGHHLFPLYMQIVLDSINVVKTIIHSPFVNGFYMFLPSIYGDLGDGL